MTFDKKDNYILTIVTGLFLFLSNNLTCQTLTIKIQNTTGHRIDSLIVGTTYIGTIENDSTTGPIRFEKFRFDSGIPYESIFGLVGEKRLKKLWWSRCGTSISIEQKGEFFFKLAIGQHNEVEYLFFDKFIRRGT